MNLKDIVVRTKTAEVPFEGLDGFVVTLAAVSREVSKKLREDSEKTRVDARTRQPVKELDEDLFLENFAHAAIKSWKGLTYRHLDSLLLIDLTQVDDMDAEVPFSLENAVTLLKSSPTFDGWVNDKVFSLESFRSAQS